MKPSLHRPAPDHVPPSVIVVVRKKESALPALLLVALLGAATWWISRRVPEDVAPVAKKAVPARVNQAVPKDVAADLAEVSAKGRETAGPFGSPSPPAGSSGRSSPTFFEPTPVEPPATVSAEDSGGTVPGEAPDAKPPQTR